MAKRQAVEVMARVPFEKAMKGAPYSAETIVESSQTLADGNRISRKTTGQVYRDSEGRTRREEDVTITARTANGPVSGVKKTISIVDPVAGFSYSLDPERKIAWKTTIGGANAIMGKLDAMDERRATLEKMTAEMKAPHRGFAGRAEREGGPADAGRRRRWRPRRRRGCGHGPWRGAGGRGRGYAMAPETPLETQDDRGGRRRRTQDHHRHRGR
jgi:hypothetical protein